MRHLANAAAMAAAIALGTAAGPGAGQGLGVATLDEKKPVEVEANQGIEWRRGDKLIVARGDATARQGNLTIRAEVLSAHYREEKGGGPQIYSVEADGHVRITSDGNTLEGAHGVYDLDQDRLTMTGERLVLVTPDQRVVADQSMEFDNKAQIATARGNASVARGDQRIRADLLKAYFDRTSQDGKKGSISRIEAFGKVLVSTPTEVARADKGTYDLKAGKATLSGSVQITRGENQLNGENAAFDLRGGTSRLTGTPGARDGRVRALIIPGEMKTSGR